MDTIPRRGDGTAVQSPLVWAHVGPCRARRGELSHPPFMMVTMTQLLLINEQPGEWRLDERTKEAGRKGLAKARAALQDAMRRAAA